MRDVTIELGFTATDRTADYVPCVDGYRPGARQALLTIGPLAVPGCDPARPLDPEQVKALAEDCFDAMNMSDEMPVSGHIAALRAAIAAALAESQDPAADGVHTLSIGDTLSVDGITVCCERFGWAVGQ
jgi:hypothetical protein